MNIKKIILSTMFVSMSAITAFSQTQKTPRKVIIPGEGHIDVEKLNKKINLNMDISNLSLYEMRVLRNAFAARQGYIFNSSDLRGIYSATSWYDSIMWLRFDGPLTDKPLKYSQEQLKFINKLKAREKELLKKNYRTTYGNIVNTDNIINPNQIVTFDPQLKTKLGKNGFAIVPANHNQLFHVYEKNDYNNFPSFVTTDLYLQLYHFYFDSALREIEEKKFLPKITELSQAGYDYFTEMLSNKTNNNIKDDIKWCQAYFAIALSLASDNTPNVSSEYKEMVNDEIEKSVSSTNNGSAFLGPDYTEPMGVSFAYSLFRPRGHYTRSERTKHYFRAMMWLQTAPMSTNFENQMRRAILISEAIGGNSRLNKLYKDIFEPVTYLMGEPDNITIMQVYNEWKKLGSDISKKSSVKKLTKAIETIAQKQIRIQPAFQHTSKYKINLMPQRYQPDGDILNHMVDNNSDKSLRKHPKGLDFFAAMGVLKAERILLNELKEKHSWPAFTDSLGKCKVIASSTNWDNNAATMWMETLKDLNNEDKRYPYFMRNQSWKKKNLNTSLASWAELKHDAILYAKQPMSAECGGYGPEPPITKGYIEPNVKFWNKAVDLLNKTYNVYKKFDLTTEKIETTTSRILELAEFCRDISQKELEGKPISDEEYNQIKIIGSTVEYISLSLVQDEGQMLDSWEYVEGADRKVAIVADVYTANGDNVPQSEHCILYEGVGPAYEIYVVVEIDGFLYLTHGAVLSYREFEKSTEEQRMTDEEWQEQLEKDHNFGTPDWMKDITLPIEPPKENERFFYSSGC